MFRSSDSAMRTAVYLILLGLILATLAIVVRSGIFMRKNPGEPINAAMRQALAGVAYQWPQADADRRAREYPGAIQTPNDAFYVITRSGTEPALLSEGKHVSVHYTARLFATGAKIDSSEDHGGPYNFIIGQSSVIPGWTDALHHIRKGEKRTIILPYWLAYGEKGQRHNGIPPKASVVLELELIDVR